MGASKSSKVIKTFFTKKKNKTDEKEEPTTLTNENEAHEEAEMSHTEDDSSSEQPPEEKKLPKKGKKKGKETKKGSKKKKTAQEVILSNRSISNLSRGLGPNDWIKLAYALGFLPQGIAHFTGRASSAQNSYSQCTLMLKTWRELTSHEEILPRLCTALQKIRRHDLAVKIGLELAVYANPEETAKGQPKILPELLQLIAESNEDLAPPYDQSKIIFTDKQVSFLARQLLAREEWKRLAYALGLLPDDASQIIASASSSQNLYAQAHLMLIKWRNQTLPTKIIADLRAGFTRIRRHDLVFLLDLGIIAAPEDSQEDEAVEKKLSRQLKATEEKKPTLGTSVLTKFRDLH